MIDARVFVLTGAGISAESGIPTFRGKDGYWRNLDPTKLATPEAFRNDPQLVWDWYRERRQRIRAAKPNPAHEAVARLATESREFLLVTQNVDDLHTRARWKGASLLPQQLVQIHGDIFVTRCSLCEFYRRDNEHDGNDVPQCPDCGALMRPGVVWFGEQLPAGEVGRIDRFLSAASCDFVIVSGTTALFGYVIDWAIRAAGQNGHVIEINPDPTALSQFAGQVIRQPAGVALPQLVEALYG